jgi:hypothetical protein
VAPTGVDTGEGAKRGENFITWEQIEPVIRPDMDLRGLHEELLHRLGLSFPAYRLQAVTWREGISTLELLRGGLIVVRDTNGLVLPNGPLCAPAPHEGA